jgi:glutamate carboxypeptidase
MSSELVPFFDARTPDMVARLKQYAEFESPTNSKPHVDALGAVVAETCADLGALITTHPRTETGDIHIATWNGDAPGKPIMFLTHIDTVWPVGTLETMPIIENDGILYGPGVLDMKAGVVIAIEAIRGLIDRDALPNRPIIIFFNSDEETGSPSSRDLIHEIAPQMGLVLVMEPAAEGEAIKT